jgi:hypothetical protein
MQREFALMNRAKRIPSPWQPGFSRRLALAALVALALGAACTKSEDTRDYVPSERGAVQPDAGGALLSETNACAALIAAEAKARASLGCDTVKRQCPAFIRPAGGEACFEYSQASVKGCGSLFDSFTSCDDFTLHPCLISAVSKCDGAGEGGASGAAGAAGAGAAGAAGEAAEAAEGGAGGS